MPSKPEQNLVIRPPVVVVMGHIDHGKSSLLDYVRKTNVVENEAGGITQHVGAYEAEYAPPDGKKHAITFLDMPGHAAFVKIRERGAKAADIAILAVSAEDGVKPQTVEAHKSIIAEKIPFVVAITKIDKSNANVEKTKQSLGENGIYVEGWGGDVPVVAISSVTGEGIPELLEMIMLVAEIADLKADPKAAANGVVVESSLDTRKGISATLLVKNGTLKTGSFAVSNDSYAPVRFIEDFRGKKIDSAAPSQPARILGWNKIPASGARFITVSTKNEAEDMVHAFVRQMKSSQQISSNARSPKPVRLTRLEKQEKRAHTEIASLEEEQPQIVTLPIILKADVLGSLEGVKYELSKMDYEKVQLKIVGEGIGEINENDVKLSQSDPNIVILGFNVETDNKALSIIERSPVPRKVRTFKIIYELAEFVRAELEANIPKEFVKK